MYNILVKLLNRLNTNYLILRGCNISPGSIVFYNVDLPCYKNFRLGSKVIIYKNNTIYMSSIGNFFLDDNSHIAPYGYFLISDNSVHIGKDVCIGPFCSFFCVTNYYGEDELFRCNYKNGNIRIGSNVFIGAHSIILPNTIIKDRVIVGANSLVSGNLESGYIYAGNPVKIIKKIVE